MELGRLERVRCGCCPHYVDVTDPSRITEDDNLSGAPADGMIDELGDLVGEFMRWLGTDGHQLASCD